MQKEKSIEILENLINRLNNLPEFHRFNANPEFDKWQHAVKRNIKKIFPDGEERLHFNFNYIEFFYNDPRGYDGVEVPYDKTTFRNGQATAKAFLESCIEEIQEDDNYQNSELTISFGFENLLHPTILKSSYLQYQNEHYRDAVLNSIVGVFDLIRQKTNSQEDGDKLIGKVFSLNNPKLILSEIETDSGKSDQKGFMQIFQGAYQGIRNPKAHSLDNDLTPTKAAQYLVFASLLARRVDEAIIVEENI